jgi:hypothetical protein
MSDLRLRFIQAIELLFPHLADPFVSGPTVPFDPSARAKLTGELMSLGPRLGISIEYSRLTTEWGPLSPGEAQTRLAQCRAYLRMLRAAAEALGAPANSAAELLATLPARLSASDLAKQLQQPPGRVHSFLRRYRQNNPHCCEEIANPARRQARYLFLTDVVWPLLVAQLEKWNARAKKRRPNDN